MSTSTSRRARRITAGVLAAFLLTVAGATSATSHAESSGREAVQATVAASAYPVIKYGDVGHNVLALQYLLLGAGYTVGTDSSFGPGTLAEVKQFQADAGMTVDGVPGPATLDELTPSPVAAGDTGNYPRAVQTLLVKVGIKVAIDGSFGPATTAGVKAWQQRKGLPVDGIVGGRTWVALFEGRVTPPTPGLLQPVMQAGTGTAQWHNCGPASLIMALLYKGHVPTRFTVDDGGRAAVLHMRYTTMGIPKSRDGDGTEQIELSKALAAYGVANKVTTLNASIAKADAGGVSIVSGDARKVPWHVHANQQSPEYLDHYLVLAGKDAQGYRVLDPLVYPDANRVHHVSVQALRTYANGQDIAVVVT